MKARLIGKALVASPITVGAGHRGPPVLGTVRLVRQDSEQPAGMSTEAAGGVKTRDAAAPSAQVITIIGQDIIGELGIV